MEFRASRCKLWGSQAFGFVMIRGIPLYLGIPLRVKALDEDSGLPERQFFVLSSLIERGGQNVQVGEF